MKGYAVASLRKLQRDVGVHDCAPGCEGDPVYQNAVVERSRSYNTDRQFDLRQGVQGFKKTLTAEHFVQQGMSVISFFQDGVGQ